MTSWVDQVDGPSAANLDGGTRSNHICWIHAGSREFHARAAAFLRDGLVMGQRVAYLGGDSGEQVRQDLGRAPDFQDLLDSPDFTVSSIADWHRIAQTLTPTDQVAEYGAAARTAVAEGYTGLRVAVEASDLVRTGPQREMFARYEHLVDRRMVDEPFAAMCGYDGAELGAVAAAELACLHPRVSPGAASFQWWAATHADMGLSGEVDVAATDLFDVTLARTMPLLAGPQLVVDARQLTFIDHRGLLTLERHALANDLEIMLRTDTPTVHRLANLLELRAVRPQ